MMLTKHWRSWEVFGHFCKQMRLGRFGCVWCSIVVRVVAIVVVFNGCSVQLLVLCQLLQCSIVKCVKLLQCSIVECVVSIVVVFNCCSVQLFLLLFHSVFLRMSRFVCNFSSQVQAFIKSCGLKPSWSRTVMMLLSSSRRAWGIRGNIGASHHPGRGNWWHHWYWQQVQLLLGRLRTPDHYKRSENCCSQMHQQTGQSEVGLQSERRHEDAGWRK